MKNGSGLIEKSAGAMKILGIHSRTKNTVSILIQTQSSLLIPTPAIVPAIGSEALESIDLATLPHSTESIPD